MRNKILWLSILGLSLARPPNPIDSRASNLGNEQKRVSRSIWPFTSSETTTEEPVTFPPQFTENNQWMVQGETVLPQGIDLNRYPVWKIHKYHGIDLRPVKLHQENTYPPELHTVVDPGYYPGSVSPPDYPYSGYQTGYHDIHAKTPGQETYSTGYPAAYSPSGEQENYKTGEFLSSSFAPGTNPFDIQTQHRNEVFAPPPSPPQPLTDFRSTAGLEPQKIPLNSYGVPNAYQSGSVNFQAQGQVGQNQALGGEGHSQTPDDDDENPNLSFLDDLGGLAPFLPDPAAERENELEEVENGTSEQGFFENLFSRFRGTTEKPEELETEAPASSGGFLSTIFGLRSDTHVPEEEPSVPQASAGVFSSFFSQQQTEKPAVVLPTTYYLPKTKGSYIAVKVPGHPAPSFAPSLPPFNGVSNIPFHQVPHVPFAHHEIPEISGPTLDSVYPYNPGYSEERHQAARPEYQSSVTYSLPSIKSPPDFNQNQGTYQQTSFQTENLPATNGETLDEPRAEYQQSYDNGDSISSNNYYNGQQNSQRDSQNSGFQQVQSTMNVAPQSEDQLPLNYPKTLEKAEADQNVQEYQYQNSNGEDTSNARDNFDQNQETVSTIPQTSGGFIPSVAYGPPADAGASSRGTTIADETIYDNSGNQNTDLSTRFMAPREKVTDQNAAPVYQSSISAYQPPSDVQVPSMAYGLPPIKESTNFHDSSSNQDEGDARFIQNLSALTSYGTPTNSYASEPFVPASSNTRITAVPPPAVKDEVNDGSNKNANKDALPTTLAERLNARKAARVLRKITKRMNSQVERYNWRRSAPERQAPTEEAGRSMVIRSEKDSIPEVRVGRQFEGTKVIDGYSKVQRQEDQFVADTAATVTKPVNPAP